MSAPVSLVRPDLQTLLDLFPHDHDRGDFRHVSPDQVPEPYHGLLVHEHHMTVTVEAYHGSPVNVVILNRRLDGSHYSRRILLVRQDNGQIVQFGIVRIDLRRCTQEVRQEINRGETPLGRILINHNVLRRIEPTAFVRIEPGYELMEAFHLDKPITTYGRLALIHCDGEPAIELLEIMAPETAAVPSK